MTPFPTHDMINRKLFSDQFRVITEELEAQRQAYFAGRVRDYHEHPEMLTPVEEMAMQNYPRWAAGK